MAKIKYAQTLLVARFAGFTREDWCKEMIKTSLCKPMGIHITVSNETKAKNSTDETYLMLNGLTLAIAPNHFAL